MDKIRLKVIIGIRESKRKQPLIEIYNGYKNGLWEITHSWFEKEKHLENWKWVIPSHSTINEVYKIIIIVKKKFMKLRIYIWGEFFLNNFIKLLNNGLKVLFFKKSTIFERLLNRSLVTRIKRNSPINNFNVKIKCENLSIPKWMYRK